MRLRHHPMPAAPKDSALPEPPRCGLNELPPPDLSDPVLEIYKRDVDRTLLVKNLSLTPAQRAQKLVDFVRFLHEIRQARRALPRRAR